MISFSGLILIIATMYCGIRLSLFYNETFSLYYLCLAISVLSVTIGLLGVEIKSFLFDYPAQLGMDWSRIISVTFALSGLAVLLWMEKPVFARFPIIFCAFPLLIIAVFPFIINSPTLKELIIGMLQGGAISIGLMLYLLKTNQSSDSYYVVAGISLLLISLLSHLILVDMIIFPEWIIKVWLSAGIILINYGLVKLVNQGNSELQHTTASSGI
ncbi:MAG: hypothetical protein WD267_08530 [Balneolales bacterium]